jgi:hypothetical protein
MHRARVPEGREPVEHLRISSVCRQRQRGQEERAHARKDADSTSAEDPHAAPIYRVDVVGDAGLNECYRRTDPTV